MGAQLGIDIVLNSVSAGMDLAGLWPRYLNIRRGAYILACLGFAVNPWQYLSNASVFLTVISGFGIFLAPFTGVLLTEYLIVRRCRLVLEDLYKGDPSSIVSCAASSFGHGLSILTVHDSTGTTTASTGEPSPPGPSVPHSSCPDTS
jgi:cytosine/uracil/thiamine/allantoin permease